MSTVLITYKDRTSEKQTADSLGINEKFLVLTKDGMTGYYNLECVKRIIVKGGDVSGIQNKIDTNQQDW